MKVFQVGLGSMGKRRIRNLLHLGIKEIIAYDVREDRRAEAAHLYGVKVIESLREMTFEGVTHVIISTPPDAHSEYVLMALSKEKHVFVEASVVDDEYDKIVELASKVKSTSLLAPSCTMRFDPLNLKLKSILEKGTLGKLVYTQHHFGLYLPKWHPYESIHDFYVSKYKTGAAREIVPFDLVYLSWLIGKPESVSAFRGKSGLLDIDIDDVYVLNFTTALCKFVQMCVDVVSHVPYRATKIVAEKGNVELDTVNGCLSIFNGGENSWQRYTRSQLAQTTSTEEMYIQEIDCFIKASQGECNYPYTIEEDWETLSYLYSAELSSNKSEVVEVI